MSSGGQKTLQVQTLGCSKNQVDTEHLLSRLESHYRILPEEADERVDCLLVNTCGFIGDAKEESVQAVLEAARRKQEGQVGKNIMTLIGAGLFMLGATIVFPAFFGYRI